MWTISRMLKESDQIRPNVGTPNARWKVAPTRRRHDGNATRRRYTYIGE